MGTQSTKIQPPEVESNLAISERGQRETFTNQCKSFKGKQNRVKCLRIDQFPYNCIGLLGWINVSKDNLKQYGTAFLVGPSLILTALHNAIDIMKDTNKSMKFYPKLKEDYYNAQHVNVKDVRFNVVDGSAININIENEYCLLLLEKQIKRKQYITLGYNYKLIDNQNTEIYGYPYDLMVEQKCMFQFGCKGKISQVFQESIQYQHNTNKGQSGAPIIATTKDNNKIAIGIHCKANNLKKINLGCRFTRKNIEKILYWAQQMTKCSQSIKTIDVSQANFNENPQEQYKKQQYAYITLIPQIKTNIRQIDQNKLAQQRQQNKSKVVLDLWKTIMDGSFKINRYPFNCIGLIIGTYMDPTTKQLRKHYGTGFLINSNIVLTSIYNLIKFEQTYVISYQNLVFYPELHGQIGAEENKMVKVLYTKYNVPKVKPSSENDIVQTSLAMLIIQQEIKRHRYILIGQNFQEHNEVYLFGYGWNQLNKISLQEHTKFHQRGSEGKIIQTTQEIIYHNAYSQNGSQGSPLLVQYVQGLFFIVGIQIRNKYEQSKNNCLALKMTNKRVTMLKKWLNQLPKMQKQQKIKKGQKKQKKQKIFSYNLKKNATLLQWRQQSHIAWNIQMQYLKKQLKSSQKSYKSDILIKLSQVSSKLGKYMDSNKFLIQQLENHQSLFINNSILQIYYYNHMGVNNLQAKKQQNGFAKFQRALKLLEDQTKQNKVDPIIEIAVYNNYGIWNAKQGNMKQAQDYFNKALKLTEDNNIYNLHKCILTNNISNLYLQSKKYQQKDIQEQLDKIFNSYFTIKSPQQFITLSKIGYNLSIYYFSIQNYTKALRYLQNYLDAINKLQLHNHPDYIRNLKYFEENIQQIMQSKNYSNDIILKLIKIMRKYIDPENHNPDILDKLRQQIMPEGLF